MRLNHVSTPFDQLNGRDYILSNDSNHHFSNMLEEQQAEGLPSLDERIRLAHAKYDCMFAEEVASRPRAMPTDFPRRRPSNTGRLALIRKLFNPNQAWRFGN